MHFHTEVEIRRAAFNIEPKHELLFIGSCFADNIGQKFIDNCFRTVKNPYGVMYNPVSILHSVRRWMDGEPANDNNTMHKTPDIVFLTLGTNHVYRLIETNEIVDNCQKRPQRLFHEEQLSVKECAEALQQAADILQAANPNVRIIVTVSPIRYAKYGFHGSQLSKATLLLAANLFESNNENVTYFSAYEIVNDELRDYRFYTPDMLHPSPQAVDYIWERLSETYFGKETMEFLAEWQPIKDALNHRPFNPDSEQYKKFLTETQMKKEMFLKKYFS